MIETEEFTEKIWKLIISECQLMMENDSSLVMYTDAKELFKKNFVYYYNLLVIKFMKSVEEELDRHKLASVIICAILQSDILGIAKGEQSNQLIGNVFLANEKIALNIALGIMEQQLRQDFEDMKLPYESLFVELTFPEPLSCDRGYAEVICRDLYYAKKYFELNPLSIANFLFLLEAYTFTANSITVNDRKKEKLNTIHQLEHIQMELSEINSQLDVFDQTVKNEKEKLKDKKKQLEEKQKEITEMINSEKI